MTRKETHLDNNRRKGSDKKREKYDKNGKYNRKKKESISGLVEQEKFTENTVGKTNIKKEVSIVLD